VQTFMAFVQHRQTNPTKTVVKPVHLLLLERGNYRMQSTLVTVVIISRRVFTM